MSVRYPSLVAIVLLGALLLVTADCSVLPRRHARNVLAPADTIGAAPAAPAAISDSSRHATAEGDASGAAEPPTVTASSPGGTAVQSSSVSHRGIRATRDPAVAGDARPEASAPDDRPPPIGVSVDLTDTERLALIAAYERDVRAADSLASNLQDRVRERSNENLTAMRDLIAMAGDAFEGGDYPAAASLARKARLLAENASKARRGSR